MKKLINGILEFQRKLQPKDRETFAKLALGQSPDALFIGCSDSRVAVNVFASTDPGDLFVVRNVGNLVPPCGSNGLSLADESAPAAIEFALNSLNVSHIIVCGHSECGAMQALVNGRKAIQDKNLAAWLKHGEGGLKLLEHKDKLDNTLAKHNRLSQLNVLEQIEHLKTYPVIQTRLASNTLKLHGWWFELSKAAVFNYDETQARFVEFDESQIERILSK